MHHSNCLFLRRLYFDPALANYSFYNVGFQRIFSPTPGGGAFFHADPKYNIFISFDSCSFQDCSTTHGAVIQMENILGFNIRYCSFDKLSSIDGPKASVINCQNCTKMGSINQTYFSYNQMNFYLAAQDINFLELQELNLSNSDFHTFLNFLDCNASL